MTEEWKYYSDGIEVSNFGNCRRNGKIINGSITNSGGGYKYIQIQKDGKRINYLFHSMISHCFIGQRPTGLVCDHIDRNSLNNNISNLRYITQLENCRNTNRFRDDIIEDDPYQRKLLIARLASKARCKNLIRKAGTGGISKRENGTFQTIFRLNGKKQSKTFKTREEAENYLDSLNNSMATI
jgi:hypothetical protein